MCTLKVFYYFNRHHFRKNNSGNNLDLDFLMLSENMRKIQHGLKFWQEVEITLENVALLTMSLKYTWLFENNMSVMFLLRFKV